MNISRLTSFLSVVLFALTFSGPAFTGELKTSPRAVLELFTSQGCSSCPAADIILDELGTREDIIALAYHVDYWDYIGWKDVFGRAANSKLQRAYSLIQRKGHVYTPQLMINGSQDVVGSKSDDIEQVLETASLPVLVGLAKKGGYLVVSISSDSSLSEAYVWLITFRSRTEVEILRGENSGKNLTYTSIVTDRRALGMWEPAMGAHIKLPLSEVLEDGDDGVAILVQEDIDGFPGRVFGAASYVR